MKKDATPQARIVALERRISNQRETTKSLTDENERLRSFVRALGYDPDDFRYSDRTPPKAASSELLNAQHEADRRLDALWRCFRFLEGGWPITARENLKDDINSMEYMRPQNEPQPHP